MAKISWWALWWMRKSICSNSSWKSLVLRTFLCLNLGNFHLYIYPYIFQSLILQLRLSFYNVIMNVEFQITYSMNSHVHLLCVLLDSITRTVVFQLPLGFWISGKWLSWMFIRFIKTMLRIFSHPPFLWWDMLSIALN